jgi:hypothetical protein
VRLVSKMVETRSRSDSVHSVARRALLHLLRVSPEQAD